MEEEWYSKRQTLVKFAANQAEPGLTISELAGDGWDVGQENISHNCSKVNFSTKVQTKENTV